MISIKLSICIATYNRGAFIAETLDSILSQMQLGVELIVVEGASPDNTKDVLVRYIAQYPELRYFREQENSGVDGDYDKAVAYARGKYCWLMTDDDLLVSGAINRILRAIESEIDMVVVNSEVRNADFSTTLVDRCLKFDHNREYGDTEVEKFFIENATYLTFIGGVVIKRDLWMARDRKSYYGTAFIHVGVIFQHPAISKVKVIAEPQIVIRYGNSMWTSRSFEIFMIKWPTLIWSFADFSAQSKQRISAKEPWRLIKNLIIYRGIGGYSDIEYQKYIAAKSTGIKRLIYKNIAIMPGKFINTLLSFYCAFLNRKVKSGLYDLARSRYATPISRLLAKTL